jgi:hypothetical protein
VGCCGDYRVRRLRPGDPPQPPSALPHLDQAGSIFAEAVSPLTGWLVVKSSGGSWVWYDPETGRTQQLAVELKPDDGPVTISDGDRLAAVSGGKVVVADAKAGGQPRELAAAGPAASSLSWGPSGRLAVVANGGVTVVDTAGEGASPAPATRYLSLAGVSSVSWSAPMPGLTLAAVRKVPAPQQLVDALLTASRLPAAVDSVAGRARTKVYVWRLDLKQAGAQNSAEAKVTKVTPAFLGQHPALTADVLWHHWAATDWLLGGCYRYRVVVSWPSGSVASTIGLGDQAAC